MDTTKVDSYGSMKAPEAQNPKIMFSRQELDDIRKSRSNAVALLAKKYSGFTRMATRVATRLALRSSSAWLICRLRWAAVS